MFDYGYFRFDSKADVLDKAVTFWNPGKTKFWQDAGIDLVIDRREGYFLYDMSGRRLIDLHLNGGTYNFGHRNPELVAVLKSALDYFDMGNHWFPSVARSAFAEKLVGTAEGMRYAIFGAGGAEAVEIALKTARYTTKRRKIVSIIKGYHGHSGLSVATGDERFSKIFLADRPEEFVHVPFNDIEALDRALRGRDVAAFIIETIPATYGFPLPDDGYLQACQDLCRRYGTLYIADEVQTGLMRCGTMWGWQSYGLTPDMFVTGKGLGGGIYPISACVVTEKCGGWLHEDGAAHISTSGGSELGCVVGHQVIDILQRPEVIANVQFVAEFFRRSLTEMMATHSDIFVGIRQRGVILGLEFDHPEGAVAISRALYEHGVWAIFSSLDKRVLQFKPGVLLDAATCQEIIDRMEAAMPRARAAPRHAPGGVSAGGAMAMQLHDDAPRLAVPDRGEAVAQMKIDRAAWAVRAFSRYDRAAVMRIARAVAEAAHQGAQTYAEWAVRETGMGVVEHKRLKNELSAHPLVDFYENLDLVDPRVDPARKMVEIPKPAGVVLALTPATNPVSTLYYKTILAVLSRCAVIFSPHPMAKACCADAAARLEAAAVAAGAPGGLIQCVEEPTVALAQALMASPKVQVILATGGGPMVRAAYASGNPAIGVGPGNAPVYVDPDADQNAAAKRIIDSKSFDNSVLCTNESVLISLDSDRGRLERALRANGAHVCSEAEVAKLRGWLFPGGSLNTGAVGKSAVWIAGQAGFRVVPSTRVLIAPIGVVGIDEPLSKEKLAPVLAWVTAGTFERAVGMAQMILRMSGAGHSAAFHGEDAQKAMDFASALPVYRVAANAPCSQGAAGFATHLAPAFMIGTGYAGRSSVGENIGPQHLVHWTRLAWNADPAVPMADFSNVRAPFEGPESTPRPAAPARPAPQAPAAGGSGMDRDTLRELILQELRALTRGQP